MERKLKNKCFEVEINVWGLYVHNLNMKRAICIFHAPLKQNNASDREYDKVLGYNNLHLSYVDI